METNDLSEWIPATEAAKLWPSPRGGKTHPATIVRWILSGKLEGWRRGRWWFVRRTEVLGLLKPIELRERIPATHGKPKTPEWVLKGLRKRGII